MQDWKITDENVGLNNGGRNCSAGKYKTGIWWTEMQDLKM